MIIVDISHMQTSPGPIESIYVSEGPLYCSLILLDPFSLLISMTCCLFVSMPSLFFLMGHDPTCVVIVHA